MLVRMWSNRNSHFWWDCKIIQSLWKTVWQFLIKLNTLLPYDSAMMLLGIYPKELKTYVHKEACTGMFTAALFIIAKTWKQPRCPFVGKWINCTTSIQWNVCHSALKRNDYQTMKRHGRTLHTKQRKPIWKGYILYHSNYMTFWKRQNYGELKKKKISGYQRLWRKDGCVEDRGFLGSATTLYTIMVDTYLLHLSKLIRCTTPTVNPHV